MVSVGSRSLEVPVGSACWDMVSVGSIHVYACVSVGSRSIMEVPGWECMLGGVPHKCYEWFHKNAMNGST